ncbi:uncharacterized protein YbjT (DUF2867 family) [Haloactinopolyspora alba]|uniref:Uncharacterized protein YbjT (DUF2867 family) n=1 Tax=Haloactinopolyspora alba TaxID=648780 RepID=A0A2P8DN98_9ACTN|nr:NAD(P)H-binding protein [Haloactinopolyspora alba]PSK98673.1 uncharacterized protein YbjT (DUF2867 family) [Haloactinopolyspora alba]
MPAAGTVLVTGATGKTGRHLVPQLLDAGTDVRAMVRNPVTAQLPAGVDVVRGDLTEPDTLHAALDGVDSVFLLWPMFSAEGAPAVVDAIARHARRVVYLSAMADAGGARPDGFWGRIEELIEAAGLEWTFLRAGGFAGNTFGWAEQIRTEGVVRWPYGAAARSLIHEADIAAVAAATLTTDGHAGRSYALTGPEAVTQAEQVRIIGEAVGRTVRWDEPTPAEAREMLLSQWGDSGYVDAALDAWAAMVERPEPVTTAVQDVTGRPARTFRQWAVDHADTFRSRPA